MNGRTRTSGRWRKASIVCVGLATITIAASACSSSSSGAKTNSTGTTTAGTSSPSSAPSAAGSAPQGSSSAVAASGSFKAPDLSGKTIRIAEGSAPQVEDTRLYLMTKILESWGAKSSLVPQTGDPAAVRVVLAGDAELGSVAVTGVINSGLLTFGPSQPRLDYHFIGAPSLKTIQDLPGHVYGTSNTHGVEALQFADILQKFNIDPSKVKVTVAGGASVRVAAMLQHHLDATFVHIGDVPKLLDAGFNDLADMSQVAPELADSVLAASPKWVNDHPDLAVAVDEAWIEAAKVFQSDKSQWVSAAVAYAGGSDADASAVYDNFKKANTFPVAKSAFSAAGAQKQEDLADQVGAITKKPAIDQWLTEKYWDQAVQTLGVS